MGRKSSLSYPVLTVAAGAGGLALEDFVFDISAAPDRLAKNASWEIRTEADGSSSLVLVLRKPGITLVIR